MLDVDIVAGRPTAANGTTCVIADINPDSSGLLGVSQFDGANARPDLTPSDPLYPYIVGNNTMSVVAADSIAALPLAYTRFDQVVNSIAGTAAHEIAHTLGVFYHDPGNVTVGGAYSVMASGDGTLVPALPLAERLNRRQFLNIPNTQPAGGGQNDSAPKTWSTTDVLRYKAGTTSVADFNFDSTVTLADGQIWNAHRGEASVGIKSGDANGDGQVTLADGQLWNAARNAGGAYDLANPGNEVPTVTYYPNTGKLSILADIAPVTINSIIVSLKDNSAYAAADLSMAPTNLPILFNGALKWDARKEAQTLAYTDPTFVGGNLDNLSSSFGDTWIATLPTGLTGAAFGLGSVSFGNSPDLVNFNVTVAAVPGTSVATWNVNASGNWNSAGHWSGSGTLPPDGANATAIFGSAITAARTITVDTAVTAGTLTFNNANAYTVSGPGTITLQVGAGNAAINVTNGSHEISAPLILGSDTDVTVGNAGDTMKLSGNISGPAAALNKYGAGTLILSGSNTYSGGTTVDAGTLIVNTITALPDGTSLTVGAGGTFTFDPSLGNAPVAVSAAATAVPEPGTLILLAAGLAAGTAAWRKK